MVARTVTGLTPRQEQRTHELLARRLGRRYEKRLRIEIYRYMIDYADNHGNLTAQAEITYAHGERLLKILKALYGDAFSIFGARILDGARRVAAGKKRSIETTPQFDRAQVGWIAATAAEKVTLIVGTSRDQAMGIIRSVVAEGVASGIGEIEMAKLIKDAIVESGGSLSRLRSRMIARTESHNASTAAAHEAAKASNLPMMREWVTSGNRSRDHHKDADGQTVGMTEHFYVGGERIMNVGEGSAKNVINCQCVIAYLPMA